MFDSGLRFLLTKALTRIEINIRTRITLMGSLHFISDPWWFCNPKYVNRGFLSKFDREVYSAVKKNPAIEEHHKKHPQDKYAPAWKTLEFMTLGNIVFLYEAIKDESLKKSVAGYYECSIKVFLNYLETIRLVRNRCAHGGCLYNLSVQKGINKHPANVDNADSHNIKGAIEVILHFIGIISNRHKTEVIKEIQNELSQLAKSPKSQVVVQKCANLANFF
jgi:abortive infection bacteriophage resistance protein